MIIKVLPRIGTNNTDSKSENVPKRRNFANPYEWTTNLNREKKNEFECFKKKVLT